MLAMKAGMAAINVILWMELWKFLGVVMDR
jgi:hypothetical protein